jgi:hypothetical protein
MAERSGDEIAGGEASGAAGEAVAKPPAERAAL